MYLNEWLKAVDASARKSEPLSESTLACKLIAPLRVSKDARLCLRGLNQLSELGEESFNGCRDIAKMEEGRVPLSVSSMQDQAWMPADHFLDRLL